MKCAVADLMRSNLLSVFNELDPERRDALAQRATELRAQTSDFAFQPNGPVSVNDDLGHLGFQFGFQLGPPANRPDAAGPGARRSGGATL